MSLIFIPLAMAVPFDDVMQRVSKCFSGTGSCALFWPLSRNTFVTRVKWLVNTTTAVLKGSFDIMLNVVQYFFTGLVSWNREILPVVAAWLMETDEHTIVKLVRDNRGATLGASALVYFAPALLWLPVMILTSLGFGVAGIIRGSPAAAYQSHVYGGFTPASSFFAKLQSLGMTMTHGILQFILWVTSMCGLLLFIFAWNLEP
ncbi:hypothetical protein DFH07DRAFT_823609 [Mycena maculata]|uniref:Uncharacterized protein n=1 Tax=Mycena maculata TaxID=230809 RepID=A0AAD7J1C0_9AGAR|nr:hypothetical protein DFH07DRAFT_823609 [Mycena maculata]